MLKVTFSPSTPHVLLRPNQQVKLQMPGDELEHPARVIDVQGPIAVLRVPEALADRSALDEVELYFGYRNAYFRGTARIQAHFDGWWFIEAPLEADCLMLQRRAFVRVAIEETLVAIRTTPLGEPIAEPCQARLGNLSASGCLAKLDQELEVGDFLLLLLALPGLPVSSIISRVVRRSQPGPSGGWYGIRFETIDAQYQEELAHFIASHIQERLREGVDVTVAEQPSA